MKEYIINTRYLLYSGGDYSCVMCHVKAVTDEDRCKHLNSRPPLCYCCETQNIAVTRTRARVCVFNIYRKACSGNDIQFLMHNRYTGQVLKAEVVSERQIYVQNGTAVFTVFRAQASWHGIIFGT